MSRLFGSISATEILPTSSAPWTIETVRYYAVDTVGGNDTNVGYSDLSQADAFTKAKKTYAALYGIIPPLGAECDLQIAVLTGTYAEPFVLDGLYGYRNLHVVASTDGSDDAADRILSGFVTSSAGPGGGGTWTTAGGATASVISVSAGALPTEANGVLRRIRFTGNVTSALANVCASIRSIDSSTQLTTSDDLPVAPATGDTFLIEAPGASFTSVVFSNIHATSIAIRGLKTLGTWTSKNVHATAEVYTGCDSAAATFDAHSTISMKGNYTPVSGAVARVGQGFRGTTLTIKNASDIPEMDRSGSSTGALAFINIPTMTGNPLSMGQTQLFGCGKYAGGGSGFGGFHFTPPVGFRGPRLEGTVVYIGSSVRLVSCDYNLFAAAGLAVKLQGTDNFCQVWGGTMRGSIQTQLSARSDITFNSAAPTTFSTTPNIVTAPQGGGANISYADVLAMTSITDPGDNRFWAYDGQNPAQIVPAEPGILFVNDSGVTLAPGNAIYVSGFSASQKPKVKLSQAGATSTARLDGVCATTTVNGAVGIMVRANNGSPFCLFDGTVSAGDPVYVSTTAGKLTNVSTPTTTMVGRSVDGDGATNPGNSHVAVALANGPGSAVAARGIVTLVSPVTDVTIPVAGGESNGRITIRGRLVGDSSSPRTITARVNGSATNVSHNRLFESGSVVIGASDLLFQLNDTGAFFEIVVDTAKTSASLRRFGLSTCIEAGNPARWDCAFIFSDTTTVITDITLHCATANGIAGGYVTYEEIKV